MQAEFCAGRKDSATVSTRERTVDLRTVLLKLTFLGKGSATQFTCVALLVALEMLLKLLRAFENLITPLKGTSEFGRVVRVLDVSPKMRRALVAQST